MDFILNKLKKLVYNESILEKSWECLDILCMSQMSLILFMRILECLLLPIATISQQRNGYIRQIKPTDKCSAIN